MRFKMDCQLVVGGGIWNERVVITNFTYRHKSGEPLDVYYSIALKRYRAPIVTTSPNPDSVKDRWYKDPRAPIIAPATPLSEQYRDKWGSDGTQLNQVALPVEDPYVSVTHDEGPAVAPAGSRESLISLEYGAPDGVVRAFNTAGMHVYEGQQALEGEEPQIAPRKVPQIPGETFVQVSERLKKIGPNDLDALLALNPWVTDNNYDPKTSHLPIGSGVKFYKENPVNVGGPVVIVTPNIGAPRADPVTGQVTWPRGQVGPVEYPGVPELDPRRNPQIREPYIR
jgi:hypothetical protein